VFSRVAIVNRGEAAIRLIHAVRDLTAETGTRIETVALYTDSDRTATFVREADVAYDLGLAANRPYLDHAVLRKALIETGADAAWVGWGFVAEDPAFADLCAEIGVTFVGPSARAMRQLGDKIGSKLIAEKVGVPVAPWSRGPVETLADAMAAADQIGYPLMLKATAGGGGRGIRMVSNADELTLAYDLTRQEAARAFGSGVVFLERLVTGARHVEVQVIADGQGTAWALGVRDCSLQRRHQKIIEEAPSPAVGDRLRTRLGDAAVAAGQTIGYVGAGTVEFVLDAGGSFYFLEVNTRLQVEHPVTELITGLDLVRVQLEVAEGRPLGPEVTGARITGHAIEARLYAEDVPAGFQPATGTLHRFAIPALPGVRVDAGVSDGSVVGAAYDPMLAKVIAHGASRDQARRRLASALALAELHGVITNRDLLVGVLREAEFSDAAIDTGYLDRHDPAVLAAPLGGEALDLHAAAAALAGQAARRATTPVLPGTPSGWRNVPNEDQVTVLRCGGQHLEVRYAFGRDGLRVAVGGRDLPDVAGGEIGPEGADLTAGGISRRYRVHWVGGTAYVDSPLGFSVLTEVPRFPEPGGSVAAGSLRAPMPGTVVRIAVAPGDHVGAHDPMVVLEAMKMEHTVRAPAAGVVMAVNVRVGQAVDTGAELALVEPADAAEPGA
jgi:acetyl/propionyl-CoA carboxylase alpha subunit